MMDKQCNIYDPICPEYGVIMYGNGNVTFNGYRHVALFGVHHYKSDPANFNALIELLNDIDYLTIQTDYGDIPRTNDYTYTAVFEDGAKRHSAVQSGSYNQVLTEVEHQIEERAGITPLIDGNARNKESLVMSLERLGGALGGPVYFLTIYGNGTVMYHGETFVAVNGTHIRQISIEDVQKIRDAFYNSGFFYMNDVYDCDQNSSRDCVTDAPSSLTSITERGETKSVYVYHGYLREPERLFWLESTIEDLAGTRLWTDCPEGQWPRYESGCTSR